MSSCIWTPFSWFFSPADSVWERWQIGTIACTMPVTSSLLRMQILFSVTPGSCFDSQNIFSEAHLVIPQTSGSFSDGMTGSILFQFLWLSLGYERFSGKRSIRKSRMRKESILFALQSLCTNTGVPHLACLAVSSNKGCFFNYMLLNSCSSSEWTLLCLCLIFIWLDADTWWTAKLLSFVCGWTIKKSQIIIAEVKKMFNLIIFFRCFFNYYS